MSVQTIPQNVNERGKCHEQTFAPQNRIGTSWHILFTPLSDTPVHSNVRLTGCLGLPQGRLLGLSKSYGTKKNTIMSLENRNNEKVKFQGGIYIQEYNAMFIIRKISQMQAAQCGQKFEWLLWFGDLVRIGWIIILSRMIKLYSQDLSINHL